MSTDDGRVLVESFGCKVSRIEALALARNVATRGAARGVVLVHTCSVTDRADRDERRRIRRLRRDHPLATLVVTGCLAQRAPDALAAMPEVDLVVGHAHAAQLPELLERLEAGLLPGKVAWSAPPAREAEDAPGVAWPGAAAEVEPGRTRAFLKIQDGCGRRCAFCIVPRLRGRERSDDAGHVEAEIRRLGEEGVPEVVLSGIHLAAYGRDRGASLLALLARLDADPPRCRVRLSSLEPMEAGARLVELVARSRALAPHLHLPAQSGSDAVLSRMRRGLTAERFRRVAERALAANPRLHLATDLIVGFPGETDLEFGETVALVETLPFASLHVFPFSPRSGTRGAELHAEKPVPPRVVAERAARLRALGEAKRAAFERANAGTEADTVVLRGGRGLTDNYLDVELGEPLATQAPGSRLVARLQSSEHGLVAYPSLAEGAEAAGRALFRAEGPEGRC